MGGKEKLIDELRAVYRQLDRLLDAAGRGAISRIQRSAEVGESYLRDLRSRLAAGREKGYDLGVLLRMLRALDVDRRIFFGQVYGSPDPVADLELEARRLGEPPEVVARVRDLLLEQGWQPPAELPEAIRTLDDYRHHDPEAVRVAARGDLEKVAAGLLPPSWGVPLLAVYGSALRMLLRLEEALMALMTALRIAEGRGDPATLADLLQRLAYVVADRGEHRRALELAGVAEGWYVRADSRAGIGKTLVDQGCWLSKLDRPRDSILVNEAALRYLPAEETSNRFAALQTLGLSHLALGELDDAQRYADSAEEIAAGVGPWQRAQLAWLQARIATSREDYAEAENLFRESSEFFAPLSSVEAALVSTELVRLLLLQGRVSEAQELASTMLRFIEPLRQNQIASAALVDLWRSAHAGRGLSLELVDRTIRRLEEGRAHGCTRPNGASR